MQEFFFYAFTHVKQSKLKDHEDSTYMLCERFDSLMAKICFWQTEKERTNSLAAAKRKKDAVMRFKVRETDEDG